MVTLNATYRNDLGRVRLQLSDMDPNVPYTLQRSTDAEPTWVDVRGGDNLSTVGVSSVDDYEYTPNVVNYYRVTGPLFYDSFNRVFPVEGALKTTGDVGDYASTPDDASLRVTGDLEIRVEFTPLVWPSPVDGTLLGKYNDDTNNRAYRIDAVDTGALRITISEDGMSPQSFVSSVSPITQGERVAARITLDVDDGGGNAVASFSTADSITGTFTEYDSSTDAGTLTLFAGTADLELGARANGNRGPWDGIIHAAQVYDGIGGTVVADVDFGPEDPGTTSFSQNGRPWTVNGDAEIIEVGTESGSTWGTADTGQSWNLGSSSTGFNVFVDDGVGVIEDTDNTGHSVEMITDDIPGAVDAELTYSITYPSSSIDDELEVNFGLRAQDFNNHYEAMVQFEDNLDRNIDIRLGKMVGGSFTALTDQLTIGSWNADEPIYVKFRVVGSQLAVKAWTNGESEPSSWQLATSDTEFTTGTAAYVRTFKTGGDPYEVHVRQVELNSVPGTASATAQVTPVQSDTFLKSITYPLLNQAIECVDWEEQVRESRSGFFNIKGRHEILGIADVGSSATFELTFITRSKAENRAMVALLTYGGLMLLQPPGDSDLVDCPVDIAGLPAGYVMVGESVQAKPLKGIPVWQWTVTFTKVAASDADGILPTTITWELLWELIGPEGTWETVWATWPTWEQLWLERGDPGAFGGGF